jgi:hypothetical protein
MMKMYFGMVGGGPLVGKDMDIMSGFGKLVNIALYKLLGTSI